MRRLIAYPFVRRVAGGAGLQMLTNCGRARRIEHAGVVGHEIHIRKARGHGALFAIDHNDTRRGDSPRDGVPTMLPNHGLPGDTRGCVHISATPEHKDSGVRPRGRQDRRSSGGTFGRTQMKTPGSHDRSAVQGGLLLSRMPSSGTEEWNVTTRYAHRRRFLSVR